MMRRLWWLFVLLFVPVADAWADYPAVAYKFMYNERGTYYTDAAYACTCAAGIFDSTGKCTTAGSGWAGVHIDSATPPNCYVDYNGGTTQKVTARYLYNCPYGGTLNGLTCIGGTPPPPLCTDTNPFIRKFYYTTKGPYTAPDHYANCQIAALEMLVCRTDATGTYCMWKVQRNGAQWTGAEAPGSGSTAAETPEVKTDPQTKSPPIRNPPADPKICGNCIPCPAGSVQAGIDADGVPLCVGTGTQPQNPAPPPTTTTKPPTTVTNSDGSTVTTQQTVQQNSDGSTTTTTTTTTTAADGSKTVTMGSSTSNNTAGTAGRQDTPNVDQMNLCKQNPNLSICRESSVGGNCTTGVTCTGDAIQCATLAAAQKLQCARQADEDGLKSSASKTLGDAILGGTDPSKATIDALVKGDTVDLSAPNLDQGGFVGGRSCLPDKTFSVMGRVVTVSFATVCNNIQPLRYIVMACAFILVYLMVARSVING